MAALCVTNPTAGVHGGEMVITVSTHCGVQAYGAGGHVPLELVKAWHLSGVLLGWAGCMLRRVCW